MMDDPLQVVPEPPGLGPFFAKDLVVVVLIGPPVLALLLCLDGDFSKLASDTLANYVPFTGFTAAFFGFYTYFLPWAERKLPVLRTRVAARLPFVVACSLLIAQVGASVLGPIHHWILGRDYSESHFPVISSIICVVLGVTLDSWIRARRRLINVERMREVEQRARVVAQLRALEARTQPHFLFNTLNTIASLIRDDPELAERTVEQTAEILRYVVEAPKQSLVPIDDELRLVSNYLSIQQARFGPRFTWSIDVDHSLQHLRIPPMSIQPLVENAMLHSLIHRRTGGQLTVNLRKEGSEVVCRVTDNGPEFGPAAEGGAKKGTGTSLRELRERLRLLFGEEASLTGTPMDEGGFMATLRVPERSLA
jgi:two-component system sensor histidine kinase AlgZ